MTDTNQKLREVFEARMTDNGKWPRAVEQGRNGCYLLAQTENAWAEWQACAEALALPTAEQVGDINVVESFTSVTKTAAPVCERDAFEHDLSKSPFEFDMDRWPDNAPVDWPGSYKQYHVQCAWDAWQARAALSAGDAGWQPIETAPKDGSDCWLLVEEEVRRGFWVEIEFEERRDLDGRYIDQTDDDAYWMDKDSGDSLEPTMFYPITKPLPPAPAMRKGQL